MTLHTVNKAPGEAGIWQSCLRLALPGSAILALENGVYGALDTQHNRELLGAALEHHHLYVLGPDLAARGLAGRLLPGFKTVDYEGFVRLCLEYSKVQNWY